MTLSESFYLWKMMVQGGKNFSGANRSERIDAYKIENNLCARSRASRIAERG